MTLTKLDIAGTVQEELNFTKKQAVEAVELLIETIKQTLGSGEDVLISGFGKFCVKGKRQRRGRNPATGNDMLLDRRRVVVFKCSGKLRKKVDGP